MTSARAIFWTVPTSFLTGRGAAGGLAFFGPFLFGWIGNSTGSFIVGLLTMAAVLAVPTALSVALRLFIHQE